MLSGAALELISMQQELLVCPLMFVAPIQHYDLAQAGASTRAGLAAPLQLRAGSPLHVERGADTCLHINSGQIQRFVSSRRNGTRIF